MGERVDLTQISFRPAVPDACRNVFAIANAADYVRLRYRAIPGQLSFTSCAVPVIWWKFAASNILQVVCLVCWAYNPSVPKFSERRCSSCSSRRLVCAIRIWLCDSAFQVISQRWPHQIGLDVRPSVWQKVHFYQGETMLARLYSSGQTFFLWPCF